LDPDCAPALSALGLVAWRLRWDWRSAEEHFRAGLSIAPEYARGHVHFGWLLQAQRRTAHSLDHVARARQIDSLSPFIGANLAWMLFTARRYSDAIGVLDDVLDLDPHYAMGRLARGLAMQQAGRLDIALPELARAAALAGDGASYYRAALGQAMAAAGLTRAKDIGYLPSALDRAVLHAGGGRKGLALDCLEQAAAQGSSHLSYLMVDPLFDPLRGERRFVRLAQSLGLA
jgi:tetratricopeptide (TPR) repeat protein